MGKPAARMGDTTAHGGVITTGQPTVLIGGKPAARVGDMHICPMANPTVPPTPHVGGPIMPPGCPTVLIGGMSAACVGDMLTCSGPPDTILPPGCPTVLIGSGGGGGGGGGGAGGGGGSGNAAAPSIEDKDSEADEGHFLNVKVVDKGGKPIVGVKYEMKAPDGSQSQGALSGKVEKTGVKQGNYELALFVITNARWSEKQARVGDTVTLSADVSGFESGTEAEFRIFERDISSADDLIDTIKVTVSGGKIEADWEYRYTEDTDDVQTAQEQQRGYSMPEYYFMATVGQAQARSGLLEYRDYVEISLKDGEGNVVPNAAYRLIFDNGQIMEGTLDSNGYKKVENVPPGQWSVEFPTSGATTRADA
jgi:uncharacterized Zn-binding protein involved in type VI secretion